MLKKKVTEKIHFWFSLPRTRHQAFSPPSPDVDTMVHPTMCICVQNEFLLLHGPTCIREHPA